MKQRYLHDAMGVIGFATLSIIMTLPLILHMGDSIPDGGDSWVYLWNLWWLKQAVTTLHASPMFTPYLHYPYGASLYFHTLNLFPSLVSVPLVSVSSLSFAYDVLVVGSLAFSAFSAYKLSHHVLSHHVLPQSIATDGAGSAVAWAAAIGACTFAFNSYHFAHLMGHLDLLSTGTLSAVALYTLRTEHGGVRNAIVCALFLLLTFLTSLYYCLFALSFIALRVVWIAAHERERVALAIPRIGGALCAFVAAASPLLVPILIAGHVSGRTPTPALDAERFSADAVAFLTPSYLSSLWGTMVNPVYAVISPGGGTESIVFLGFVCVALSLLAVRRLRSVTSFWVTSAVVYCVLCLGPTAHILGRRIPLIGPAMLYRYMSALPYGDIPRVPARFAVMASLCLSVVAAVGAWTILNASRRKTLLALAIMSACLLEHAIVPVRLSATHVPPVYQFLASRPHDGALLEIPIPDDPARFPRRMLFQTIHQFPVFGGYLARGLPPLRFEAIPGFAQFMNAEPASDDVIRYSAADLNEFSLPILNYYGATYAVIDKSLMSPAGVERLRKTVTDPLKLVAEFDDASDVALRIPSAPRVHRPFVWLDTGWSYLERTDSPLSSARTFRWVGSEARLGLISPGAIRARIVFAAHALRTDQSVSLLLGDRQVDQISISASGGEYSTQWFQVSGGATILTLRSAKPAESAPPDSRLLSIAFYSIGLEWTTSP